MGFEESEVRLVLSEVVHCAFCQNVVILLVVEILVGHIYLFSVGVGVCLRVCIAIIGIKLLLNFGFLILRDEILHFMEHALYRTKIGCI